MARPQKRQFDGLLNVHKPPGPTSAQTFYRVRALTGIRKSGHAGTLDPAANGVLLVCMGRGTKRVEQLMNLAKTYRATARLDVTSSSFDSDAVHEPVEVSAVPSAEYISAELAGLEGRIDQLPPAISALKVGGVPAYKLARRGRDVDLKPRPVHIYHTALLSYDWPNLEFEVRCGRGTYIRSIIRDLGARLGTGGCLTGLTRSAVGPFTLDNACSLDDLEAGLFEQHRVTLDALDDFLRECE